MSIVLSLLQAIVRVDGDALVLHVGEKPYVVAPTGQVDLATRGLTFDAVFGILAQLLPVESQAALEEFGAVQYELPRMPEFAGEHFTVVCARGGDDVWMEVRRRRVPDDDLVPLEMFAPTSAAPEVLRSEATDMRMTGRVSAVRPRATSGAVHSADSGDDGLAMPDMTQLWPGTAPAPARVLAPVARAPGPVLAAPPPRDPEPPSIVGPRVAERPRTAEPPRVFEPPLRAVERPRVFEPPRRAVEPSRVVAPPPAEPPVVARPTHVAVVPPPAAVMDPEPLAQPMARVPMTAAGTPSAPEAVRAMVQPVVLEAPRVADTAHGWTPASLPKRVEAPPETRSEDESVWTVVETVPEIFGAAEPSRPLEVVPNVLPSAPVRIPVETPAEQPAGDSWSAWAGVETELDPVAAVVPAPPPQTRVPASASLPAANPSSGKAPQSAEPTPRVVVVPPPPAEPSYAAETPVWAETAFRPEAPSPTDTPRPPQTPRSTEAWSSALPPDSAVVLPITKSPIRWGASQPGAEHGISGLDHLLRLAIARGASTVYVSSNARPSVRVDGDVQTLDGAPILGRNDVESLLLSVMPPGEVDALRIGVASEWICELPDLGRVRCMNFSDHRGPGGVFRMVSVRAMTSEQLGLSREIQSLAGERDGLVLIAGQRSSGKRTLIGGLVDLIGRTRRDHIITVEREVNVVQERHASFISQREARGLDDTLAVARGALREDPDILVLHEARSAPLMTLALEAAAAGRLVIAGFTAPSASGAIERIVDLYPPEYGRQVQLSLAHHLRGVVGQVLLPKIGGGRIAAREVLLNTPAMASVFAGKTWQLPTSVEAGRQHGMMPLSDTLVELVQNGAVQPGEAYRRAPDPAGFLEALRRQGIDTSFTQRLA